VGSHASQALRKKFVMSTLIKKISLTFVLSVSTLAAFANPGQGRGERDVGRAVRQQQDVGPRNEPQGARGYQHPEPDRASEESQKKNNKLSPEERRALRRQINEAGQDLYSRKP
jgi:hypothetical protein